MNNKKGSLDTTIIEHLACLEINECILQPPFHLVSNVQWNDKGLSFDGDISIYSSKVKKDDFVGIVPLQIKGTTSNRKTSKKNKIKHPIKKDDMEVYYKNGNGVLYFVVTINPNTYVRQAYYRILAPLDLKDLLIKLKHEGKKSYTIPFKKLEKDSLENICKQFLRIVEKQPKRYIEADSDREFTEYKIDYVGLEESSFNLFEESAYIYGVDKDLEIPLRTARLQEVRGVLEEEIILDNEVLNIKYEVRDSEDKRYLTIENSLIVEVNKNTQKGKLNLLKVKSLGSYLRCLKIVKYLRDNNKIPLKHEFFAALDKKDDFAGVEQDIKDYDELIETCRQIGISENYCFNNNEDIGKLFNGIISIFRDKQYYLLTGNNIKDFENALIHTIKLSDYVKVKVIFMKEKDKFIDFFSEKALNTIGGLLPKESIKNNKEDNYWKVSILSNEPIKAMKECANFNFEILKESFKDKYHDVKSPNTLNIALDYINYFDQANDEKYLDVAEDLIKRYLKEQPQDILAKINMFQIRIRKDGQLSEEEVEDLLDILEEAERGKEKSICFACELLLGNKSKARRLFSSLDKSEQDMLKDFPIYNLFQM